MRTVTADLVVVGGGLGGVAAALAACDAGRTVVLTEETDRLGGQVTSQLVSALDEHPLVERAGRTRTYAGFRDAVRAAYVEQYGLDPASTAARNPGGGWVSRLCFEPGVGAAVLERMLAPHVTDGRLSVLTGTRPTAAVARDGSLERVDVTGDDGTLHSLRATAFADATELGDLLAVADVPRRLGAESRAETGEAHAMDGPADPRRTQAITMAFVVEHRPGEDHTVARPDDLDRWRPRFTLASHAPDGTVRRHGMFRELEGGVEPFWNYRRLRDGRALDPTGRTTDVAVVNWHANDHDVRPLVHHVGRDDTAIDEARRLSYAFLHWLQTEAPHDDGEGRGFPGLRLAPEVAGTADGFAVFPYVREGRRLDPLRLLVEDDVVADGTSARARPQPDAVALGWYHLDVHARVGDPTTTYAPTAPFQVPAASLVGPALDNLVAAGKAVGVSHVVNAATRVHHAEWAVGEAAGALLAESLDTGVAPRVVATRPALVRSLQRRLLARGAPVAWFDDLQDGDPAWAAAQLVAVAAGLDAARRASLSARPDAPVTAAEATALATAARGLGGGRGALVGLPWGAAVRLVAGEMQPTRVVAR